MQKISEDLVESFIHDKFWILKHKIIKIINISNQIPMFLGVK